ncbi:MAG: hypothetical protein HYZ37_13995 [Candidatus Solibacter usitatus]|nr:hypothetical protein [Candidatus Solibacter usitatus]
MSAWLHLTFRTIRKDRQGQELMEYALLTALFALVIYAFLPSTYSNSLNTIWTRVTSLISQFSG